VRGLQRRGHYGLVLDWVQRASGVDELACAAAAERYKNDKKCTHITGVKISQKQKRTKNVRDFFFENGHDM
jgi:hypothetical protein